MNQIPRNGRREFLRTGLRWAAAGLLAGGTGAVLIREAGADCRRPSLCGACPVYSGCELPRATAYRGDEAAGELRVPDAALDRTAERRLP